MEVDYLHKQPPISDLFPAYGETRSAQGDPCTGKACQVLMVEPRSSGKFHHSWFSFGVEEGMPVVGVPLLNDDEAYLRLNDIYALTVHKTFGGHINYLEAPLDWETYLPGDQDWIVARMKTVYAGLQSGTIGEGIEQQEPLPITVEVEGARHELGDLLAEIGRNRERDRGQSLDM